MWHVPALITASLACALQSSAAHAEQWSLQGLGWLPGTTANSAFGLSRDGTAVAGGSDSEAFRWTAAGGMLGLSDLPGGNARSEALAVSANGAVVVGFGSTEAGFTAFRWTSAEGMVDLKSFLIAGGADLSGRTLTHATGISDDGRVITGYGTNPDGAREAWIAVVPEPSSCALAALACASLLLRRWHAEFKSRRRFITRDDNADR